MAQLGRFDHRVPDTLGNAISGASVTLYREGATVNGNQSGTTPLTVTVRHRGKIAAADTVFINTTTGTTYAVNSVTATTVVLSGFAGTLSLTGGDRIVPSNSKPTLYGDDQGGATTGNPLTTSATGMAQCWMDGGIYETLVSGGGATTTLFQSQVVAHSQEIEFNVRAWGAVGDGTTNDSSAINAAITEANERGGGVVLFPRGNYKCNITLKQHVTLLGVGGRSNDVLFGSFLDSFNNAVATITIDPAASHVQIRDLMVYCGTSHAISRATGTGAMSNFTFENCTLFGGTSGSSIYFEGDVEEIYVRNVRMTNGQYGFYHANVAEGGGGISAMARSSFTDVLCTGQSVNGIRLHGVANNISYSNVVTFGSQQSGIRVTSTASQGCTFIACNIEQACLAVVNARYTTGSITTGTPTLTVADATGYSIGDTATVQGADTNGGDLISVITNVVGSVITLTNNASTTVTNGQVNRSTYDMLQIDGGGASDYVFIGCNFADGNSPARYVLNLQTTVAGVFTFIGCWCGASNQPIPIYDPNGYAMVIGGRTLHRRTSSVVGDNFRVSTFSNADLPGVALEEGPRTLLLSSSGGNFTVGLRDSVDDGTGTYGEFEIRKRDATRSRLFRVDSAGGMYLVDGITAPSTSSGFAVIYVDTSDGDLKVKFGDGTVKTIVVDT